MRFPIRPVLIFFAVLIPVYLLVYAWIEGRRVRQGPWVLRFETAPGTRQPSLTIRHEGLGIQSALLRFPAEVVPEGIPTGAVELILNKPELPLPFGKRVSEDLMFLPGVETMDLFGHEVELAPRVLVVDRKEIPWQPSFTLDLDPSQKLPPELRERKKKGVRP